MTTRVNILRRYAVLALVLLCAVATEARTYTTETLKYQIIYQWGFIWKHAGDATLTIKRSGDGYQATLTGKTRSWADKVYPVRDTLKCTMNNDLQPLRYEKLTHEKDYYARDLLTFNYNYSHTTAKATRYRNSGTSSIDLSAQCQAYDMLSVFYMLREVDFSTKKKGAKQTTVIFSGNEKEYLTIRYKGVEKIKLRSGAKREAYHLVLKFTQKGGTKSSDDIDAWLSADDERIPLLLVGNLPVGQVKCHFVE